MCTILFWMYTAGYGTNASWYLWIRSFDQDVVVHMFWNEFWYSHSRFTEVCSLQSNLQQVRRQKNAHYTHFNHCFDCLHRPTQKRCCAMYIRSKRVGIWWISFGQIGFRNKISFGRDVYLKLQKLTGKHVNVEVANYVLATLGIFNGFD